MARNRTPGALRILQVANGFPPADRGGAERYTQLLCHALAARGHAVMVFCRSADRARPDLTVLDRAVDGVPVRRVVNNFTGATGLADYYHSRPIEDVFARTLAEWRPDVVHFQHAIGLSASLPVRARAEGLPVVWTAMDYWPICPINSLLLADGSLCPGSHHGANCNVCLFGGPRALPGRHLPDLDGAGAGLRHAPQRALGAGLRLVRRRLPGRLRQQLLALYQRGAAPVAGAAAGAGQQPAAVAFRAAYMRAMLTGCSAVITLRPFALDLFADFGVPRDRLRSIDPGIDTRAWPRPTRPGRPAGAPLVLGYIGSLMRHKGVDVIVRALAALPDRAIELRLHGFYVPDDPYAAQLRDLLAQEPRARAMGAYAPEDLPGLLGAVDAVLVPSPWHETYSFVTREAVLAGVPVLASDMGGMRDAIEDGRNGRLLPPGDVSAWANAIRELHDCPATLAAMAAAQATAKVRDVTEAASELEALYAVLLGGARRPAGPDGRRPHEVAPP